MSYLSAYELGRQAAEQEYESGDVHRNPFNIQTEWGDYCNWDIGFNEQMSNYDC